MNNQTITAVPGIEVGHWTDLEAATGVTVVSLPEPNRVAVEARGGAPGTRETALLAPGMKVETVQAIVFSGGSAFGLASADGVMQELAAEGRGHPTPAGPVPIVPAAILYDLIVGAAQPPDGAADSRPPTPATSERAPRSGLRSRIATPFSRHATATPSRPTWSSPASPRTRLPTRRP